MKKSVMNIAALLIALFGVGFGIGCLISLISSKGGLSDGEHHVTICATTDIHGAYRQADGRYTVKVLKEENNK